MSVKPIPDGCSGAIPYLSVRNAAKAIEFYRDVLGAVEKFRIEAPSGMIGHSELMIGDALIFVSEEYPDMGLPAPESIGRTAVSIQIYVKDSDAVVARAEAAGAKVLRPVADQFYGDRSGQFLDPFGHRWNIATRIFDMSPEEMNAKAKQLFG